LFLDKAQVAGGEEDRGNKGEKYGTISMVHFPSPQTLRTPKT
jgi:hypothetical protein